MVERNPAAALAQPLRLHGEELTLTSVRVNGESVSFRHEAGQLTIDIIAMGLLGCDGRALPLRLSGEPPAAPTAA